MDDSLITSRVRHEFWTTAIADRSIIFSTYSVIHVPDINFSKQHLSIPASTGMIVVSDIYVYSSNLYTVAYMAFSNVQFY